MHVCTGISPFIIGINNPWYVGSKNYGDSVTSVVRHTKIDTKSKYKFVALYIYTRQSDYELVYHQALGYCKRICALVLLYIGRDFVIS